MRPVMEHKAARPVSADDCCAAMPRSHAAHAAHARTALRSRAATPSAYEYVGVEDVEKTVTGWRAILLGHGTVLAGSRISVSVATRTPSFREHYVTRTSGDPNVATDVSSWSITIGRRASPFYMIRAVPLPQGIRMCKSSRQPYFRPAVQWRHRGRT